MRSASVKKIGMKLSGIVTTAPSKPKPMKKAPTPLKKPAKPKIQKKAR